jgi:hypothetical protein
MNLQSRDYVKYFRIGEIANLRIEENEDTFLDLTCVIAQVSEVSAELVVMHDELPARLLGSESPATITAIVGYLQCSCRVVIGRNSFEQTVFARFDGEATVRIMRNYIRQDVLIPFLYDAMRGFTEAEALVRKRSEDTRLQSFTCEPYGESFKAVGWLGQEDLVPLKINLGGGGVRFATVDPFQRSAALALQLFLDWPTPRVIHAVLRVTRSKPFEQTPEDRAFYNWAKLRLKSNVINITAGSYEYIGDEDRQFVLDFIKEKQPQLPPEEEEGAGKGIPENVRVNREEVV